MGLLIAGAAISAGIIFILTAPHVHQHYFGINNTAPDESPMLNDNPYIDTSDNEISFNFDTQRNKRVDVCLEKECVAAAASLLEIMDATVNPCDNFYKFVCGKYKESHPIPEDKSHVSQFSVTEDALENQLRTLLEEEIRSDEPMYFKNLKNYYKQCMDEEQINKDGLTDIKEIIRGLGGWPVITNAKGAKWDEVFYAIQKLGVPVRYLLYLNVDSDYKNSTVRTLEYLAPSFELKREFLVQGKNNSNVQAYYKYMVETVQLFGATENIAKKDMAEVLDFEIALATASKSLAELRSNLTALYNVFTIEELEEIIPDLPWMVYTDALSPEYVKIDKNTSLILTEPDFTRESTKLIRDTPNRTIVNYLIWRTVYDVAKYLSSDIRELTQQFTASVLGSSQKPPRYNTCIKNIVDKMNAVISSLYVRKLFDMNSKRVALELVKYIKEEVRIILMSTNWLESDKKKAIEKVNALHEHIAFPDELLDDAKMESVYGEIEIDESSYLKSTLKIGSFNRDFNFKRLDQPVNKTDWVDNNNAVEVNAYYDVSVNGIILPAAILQRAFFNANFPKYVNFAAIGSVIAHEITHGFDDVGHQFNKDGELENWWSSEAETDFEEKTKCLIDQYDGYTIFNGQHLNGELTVGENIADFGGAKTAYLAYGNWTKYNDKEFVLPGLNLTVNQLFWVSGANLWCINDRPEALIFKATTNSHSPEEFRVNGPLSNLPMFAKDFNCPKGSTMNPVKKCTPW